MKAALISSLVVSTAALSPAALVITEVMSNSDNPGGPANGDWFELTNTGPSAINLEGYFWDDDGPSADDGALFPAITLNSMASLVIVDENADNLPGFLAVWGGGFDAVSRDDFGGMDDFSSLSAGGDQIQVWDADPNAGAANLVASVTFGESTAGFSFEWDTNGNPLGLSVDGENGAFVGGEDVASPGITVVPEPSVALLGSFGLLALLRRQR